MSPLIKNSSVESVLAAADIVDVISSYTSLRKRGSTYTGLCPFHQEKTPSFSVSADKGLYYCFGCGEGGRRAHLPAAQGEPELRRGGRDAGRAVRRDARVRGGGRRATSRPSVRSGASSNCCRRRPGSISASCGKARKGTTARAYLETRGLGREVCDEFQVGLGARGVAAAAREGAGRGVLREGTGECGVVGATAGQDLRSLSGPLDVPAGRPSWAGGRVRGPYAHRRDAQVPQLARGPRLPQGTAPLRAVPGAACHRPSRRGPRGRRLHRRARHGAGRGAERGGLDGHRADRGATGGREPADHQRDVHVRRRSGGDRGGPAFGGARPGPSSCTPWWSRCPPARIRPTPPSGAGPRASVGLSPAEPLC